MTMRLTTFYCICITFLASALSSAARAESLSIYFADVGMGNATLLHQPGKCAMLVNSGPQESGSYLLDVMQKAGVKVLDFVVVTHPSKDNFGGLQSVTSKIKIRELSDNGDMNEEEDGFGSYSRLQFSLPYSVLAKGDSWRCGDMNIDVLHPSPTYDSGEDYSGRSLVLRISYNNFRLLLMGDVSAEGERKMLQSKQNMGSMVLQVGNLGESNEVSSVLLDRVDPKIAIFSAGTGSGDLMPDRLATRNIRAFSVEKEGTIQLRVAENGNIRLKP